MIINETAVRVAEAALAAIIERLQDVHKPTSRFIVPNLSAYWYPESKRVMLHYRRPTLEGKNRAVKLGQYPQLSVREALELCALMDGWIDSGLSFDAARAKLKEKFFLGKAQAVQGRLIDNAALPRGLSANAMIAQLARKQLGLDLDPATVQEFLDLATHVHGVLNMMEVGA